MQMKSKLLQKINIGLFLSLLIVPSLLWGIVCITGNAEKANAAAGELTENRNLAEKPFDKFDTAGWESYYNDRIPFRTAIINADNNLESKLEKIYRKDIMPVLVKWSGRKASNVANVSVDDLIGKDTTTPSDKTGTGDGSQTGKDPKPDTTPDGTGDGGNGEGGDGSGGPDGNGSDTEPKPHTHKWVVENRREPSYTDYGRTMYVCEECGEVLWGDFDNKLLDDSFFPLNYASNQVFFGRNDWLFFEGVNSIEYYQGKELMSDAEKARVVANIQRLEALCDTLNIELVLMINPNREQVYPEYMPTVEIDSDVKRIPDLVSYVRENTDVKIIYPLDELKWGKLYYDTCYQYDTHWNYWGAFIGAQRVLDTLGLETVNRDSIRINETEGLMKGLIATGALNASDFPEAKDYVPVYRPDAGVNIIEGGQDIYYGYSPYYASEATNPLYDKKITVIGDSFRVPMVNYLEKDFAKTVSIQRESITVGEQGNGYDKWVQILTSINESDVLVIETVERFDNEFYGLISDLAACYGY